MILHPKYRSDIDGLRAIAVLSVVAFHAFPAVMTGGFTGVDVFFVISGFLISTILFESLEHHQLSFIDFYSRRIRRIFPALIVVLGACYALGWFAFSPHEYKQLGKHMAGGAGFIQNFILLGEVDYFDNAAETKPFLHLWSLGIEEQFYIVWPVLLWVAYRVRINLLALTLVIGVISFGLNIYGVKDNGTGTFYSPDTRFWELLIGATLAYLSLYPLALAKSFTVKPSLQMNLQMRANLCSALGVALLILGFVLISKKSLFPGWWALLPTLGSALILAAGPSAWINKTILSNKILIWFGLISYPLYLWHWALLSFARIMEGQTPNEWIRAGLVVASIALSAATYYLIEKPIRFGKHQKIKTIILIIVMSIIVGVGYNTFKREGLRFRFIQMDFYKSEDERMSKFFEGYGSARDLRDKCDLTLNISIPEICYTNNPRYKNHLFVVGDSTAGSLLYGLLNNLDLTSWQIQTIIASGCQPTTDITTDMIVSTQLTKEQNSCFRNNEFAHQAIKKNRPDVVIISGRSDLDHNILELKRISALLINEGIKKVLVVGKPPEWDMDLPLYVFRKMQRPISQRTQIGFNQASVNKSLEIQSLFNAPNTKYIDLASFMCNKGGCLVYWQELESSITSLDKFHLSAISSDYLAKSVLIKSISSE